MAPDQNGQAGKQMAWRGEMQEVSGLAVAHGEDQTYGKPDARAEERMLENDEGILFIRIQKSVVWEVRYSNAV